MRTTVALEFDDVAKKLRGEMRRSGQSFKALLDHFLRIGLNSRKEKHLPAEFRVTPRPLKARPGVSLDNVGELLEQLEGETHF